MPNSARRNIAYPVTGPVRTDSADIPRDVKRVIDALEIDVIYGQGTFAARPAFGLEGRIYAVTSGANVGRIYYDNGTAWLDVNYHDPAADHLKDLLANRPAAATATGKLFTATDDNGGTTYLSDGAAWIQIGAAVGAINRRYNVTIGDGVATGFTINHAFASKDVEVIIRESAAPFSQVFPEIQYTDTNNVTAIFDVPPAVGAYNVVVWGGAAGVMAAAHAATHDPGGTDPLAFQNWNRAGVDSGKPAAAASNNGMFYFSTDVSGGTLYRSNGVAWVKVGKGVTEGGTTVATTIALLGTAIDGKTGMIIGGTTPYDFKFVTYSATYGKWISEEEVLDKYMVTGQTSVTTDGRLGSVGNADGFGVSIVHKPLTDAGLTLQLRTLGIGLAINGGATGAIGIDVVPQTDGDTVVGATTHIDMITGITTRTWKDSGWINFAPATPKRWLDVFLTFRQASGSNSWGTAGVNSAVTILKRWIA